MSGGPWRRGGCLTTTVLFVSGLAILGAAYAWSQEAPKKDVTITLNVQEQQAFLAALNDAVKARGLDFALAAAVLQKKLLDAGKVAQAPVEKKP